MIGHGFHPEALAEYAQATRFYLSEASPQIASEFVEAFEKAVRAVREDPGRWRVVEDPGVRRCRLRRFPYALFYRWEAECGQVSIYAVMHLSRRPGYWRSRLK